MQKGLLIAFVLFVFGASQMVAQFTQVPDSLYEADVLLVWFQDGIIDSQYLGCDTTFDATGELPFTSALFNDSDLYGAISSLNVLSVSKAVPNLSPCRDTLSLARRGDTIVVPPVWNLLRFEIDLTGSESTIPEIAYQLTLLYHPRIRLAYPSMLARMYAPKDSSYYLGKGQSECSSLIDPSALSDPKSQNLYTTSYGPYAGSPYGTDIFSAWDIARGSGDVKVAIVDDGVYGTSSANPSKGHEDLTAGANSHVIINGVNYLKGPRASDTYYQTTDHGTKVAGIVAAITNNSKGIAGIAGGSGNGDYARLYALKAGFWHAPSNKKIAPFYAISAAIYEAATKDLSGDGENMAADIINVSIQEMPEYSTGLNAYDPSVYSAIAYAYNNDVPVINSIGNNDIEIKYNERMGCPASADEDHIIVVGGFERFSGTRASGTAFGSEVLDFSAPVENLTLGTRQDHTTGYSGFTGTSSASPHVAGIAALMKEVVLESAGQSNVPDYLAVEDYAQIMAEGVSWGPSKTTGTPLQKSQDYGYGIVNARTTLDLLTSPYELKHIYVPYSAEAGSAILLDNVVISRLWTLDSGDYNTDYIGQVLQYEFTVTVSFGQSYPEIIRTWIRGADTKGFPNIRSVLTLQSGIPFNHTMYSEAGWAEVISFTTSSAVVKTYLYQIWENDQWVWLKGIEPDDIVFALSVLSGPSMTQASAIEDNLAPSLAVYPTLMRQANQNAVAQISIENRGDLVVFDALGRSVYSKEVQEGNSTVLIPGSIFDKNGVYFVSLRTKGRLLVEKLVHCK